MMGDACRVLVVIDDPATKDACERGLAGQGHAAFTASTGEDALWQLEQGGYDLVVTGMVLRGISGLELAEEAQARQPTLPVIIVDGDTSVAARESAAVPGMLEFLRQPLSVEQLAGTVSRLLQAADSAAKSRVQAPPSEHRPARESGPLALRLKNIGLFLLGPLISLFYLLTFPIIGLGMLIHMAFTAKVQRAQKTEAPPPEPLAKSSRLKAFAIMLGMVGGGVAYAVIVPLLGIGLVVWFSLQAWGKLGGRALGPGQA